MAHEQLPPHSATMPGRLLRTDPSITLWPTGTSTDDVEPSGSWYMTVGMAISFGLIGEHLRGSGSVLYQNCVAGH
ncbi:hypothetical protein Pd630_LPD06949 [Rhodococcus opacus PD630]|nr:hypothetical protein Pd630_LPD06949 [Rhodococcus opacus PD630]